MNMNRKRVASIVSTVAICATVLTFGMLANVVSDSKALLHLGVVNQFKAQVQ